MKNLSIPAILFLGMASAAFASEGVDDVVKLQRLKVDNEVVLAFVQHSPVAYDLSADDMVRLEEAQVPATVILAMMDRGKQLRETPEVVVPAEGQGDLRLFYESLSPYGTWSQEADNGWVWEPNDAARYSGWRPYTYDGHWIWTDHGWYWESDAPYGWAVFHYGRWGYNSRHRWSWSPDNVWGPAWVDWRQSDDHIGWAPLPFGSRFQNDVGFSYQGRQVGFNFNFGLEEDRYSYIPSDRFLDLEFRTFLVPDDRRHSIHNRTKIVNNTYVYNDNRIINNGVSALEISRITKRTVEKVTVLDANIDVGKPIKGDRRKDNTIAAYRPKLTNQAPVEPTAIVERQKADAKRASTQPENRKAAQERLAAEKDALRKLSDLKEKTKAEEKAGRSIIRTKDEPGAQDRKKSEDDTATRKAAQEADKDAKNKVKEEKAAFEERSATEAKRATEKAPPVERKAASKDSSADRNTGSEPQKDTKREVREAAKEEKAAAAAERKSDKKEAAADRKAASQDPKDAQRDDQDDFDEDKNKDKKDKKSQKD